MSRNSDGSSLEVLFLSERDFKMKFKLVVLSEELVAQRQFVLELKQRYNKSSFDTCEKGNLSLIHVTHSQFSGSISFKFLVFCFLVKICHTF